MLTGKVTFAECTDLAWSEGTLLGRATTMDRVVAADQVRGVGQVLRVPVGAVTDADSGRTTSTFNAELLSRLRERAGVGLLRGPDAAPNRTSDEAAGRNRSARS
jgi:hypothetical protein